MTTRAICLDIAAHVAVAGTLRNAGVAGIQGNEEARFATAADQRAGSGHPSPAAERKLEPAVDKQA